MNDKKQGQSRITLPDGTTAEGPMVDGVPQGQWTFTHWAAVKINQIKKLLLNHLSMANVAYLLLSLYLGFWTLVLAVLTLYVTSKSYHEQILQFSWNTISSHEPGNSGISTALEYLHSHGERLIDIDLIPKVYARDENETESHRANVTNASLSNVDLSGSWLDDTDFSNSVLINAILNDVRMDNTILDGVNLTEAHLEHADITNTRMTGTIAKMLNAREIRLGKSTLLNTEFEGAILNWSKISNTNVLSSNFSDVNLESAVLEGSNFINVSFANASFQNAVLLNTIFHNVNLSAANFTGVIGLEEKKVGWSSIWAWDDKKPIGLPQNISVQYYLASCRELDDFSSIIKPANDDCKAL